MAVPENQKILAEIPDISACPMVEDKTFRLKNQKLLLTYKSHLPKSEFILWLNEQVKGQCPDGVKFCRIAHEQGSSDTPYDHSHVLVDFGKQFQSRQVRVFDWKDIHPHIKRVLTKNHWRHCISYIAKEDPENEDLVQEYNPFEYIWSKPSLQEALLSYGKLGMTRAIMDAYNCRPMDITPTSGELRNWQSQLLRIIEKPVDRTVNWILDFVGNAGKSWLSRYLMTNYPGKCYACSQFGGQYHAATIIRSATDSGWRGDTVILDVPRSSVDKEIYGPIEDIKNGLTTSLKNNGRTIVFNPCHVVVFSNYVPKLGMLSFDRWKIYTVEKMKNDFYLIGLTFREISIIKQSEQYKAMIENPNDVSLRVSAGEILFNSGSKIGDAIIDNDIKEFRKMEPLHTPERIPQSDLPVIKGFMGML